jgi:hypothetical protein
LNKRFQLTNLSANDEGKIDSLTLISPDDFAALDICYIEGEEATEQIDALVDDLKKGSAEFPPPVPWEVIKKYDARLDVLHFEQVSPESADDEGEDEMLDPSALLVVLGALASLTGGVAVDPQSGTLFDD